ncbi:918_t:CDS:1, partial [Gigaspora rosea]
MSSNENKTTEQPEMDINAKLSSKTQTEADQPIKEGPLIKKETTTLDMNYLEGHNMEDMQIDRKVIVTIQGDANID